MANDNRGYNRINSYTGGNYNYAKTNVNNTGIGSYHLAENPALYEPARDHTFKFVLNGDLATLLRAYTNKKQAGTDDYLHQVDDVISISVAEASVPHFDIEVLTMKRGNSVVKYAGAPSWGEGSLKLDDFVGARTKDCLMAWNALVYDADTDVVHLADNYKYDCHLIEYNGDFSKIIRTFTLKGCWLKSISESNFTHNDNNLRQIDATIVYDRAIVEPERVVSE